MKITIHILVIILLLTAVAESWGQKQTINNDFITVDVTKSYSSKKELILQDFADVEYVVLETNDEFIHQGVVMAVDKKFIVVKNMVNNGNIFVYDRSGKALRRINRRGYSGEDYTNIGSIILDEENKELFVFDHQTRKFLVYDLRGKFKRSFKQRGSADALFYTSIFNYDKDHLICYDENDEVSRAFVLISKKDGNITKEFKIPLNNKKHISLTLRTSKITEKTTDASGTVTSTGITTILSPRLLKTIIPFEDKWTLVEYSSDTVYTFSPDNYSLRPIFVRTPPIQSMDPKIILRLNYFSDRYYFMEAVKYVYDWKTRTGLPGTPFMYDRQEKAFYGYTVYNGDYSTKKEVSMNHLKQMDQGIVCQRLEAFELVESYEKGQLKGKLKEIAAKLDEEDNPVIMLVKQKFPSVFNKR